MEQLSSKPLEGKRVAMLMTDGVEQIEYTSPRAYLEERGATVVLLAPKPAGATVQGFHHLQPADTFRVELDVADARPMDFDALVLPGGVANPDQLRMSRAAIDFIRDFDVEDKMVAAICHGPWTLIDAGIAQAKHLTSWPSLKRDLLNAGAEWTDEAVVIDARLVTSRKPDDLPAFNDAIFKELMVAAGTDPGPTS
ncbi:type 1 glutamine amidotransferase domain-containing protein [uncultured Massilia sp.]|uniref:type 1 glutamine amidotransferase domain-containing protein n=1 Tax=uncultured Massilia sp. TaxID=169973 RepID=UPI0025F275E6|nr:type 1 glutamine amidotransferase domain-containing protein [uncultured Massilia sp.]